MEVVDYFSSLSGWMHQVDGGYSAKNTGCLVFVCVWAGWSLLFCMHGCLICIHLIVYVCIFWMDVCMYVYVCVCASASFLGNPVSDNGSGAANADMSASYKQAMV